MVVYFHGREAGWAGLCVRCLAGETLAGFPVRGRSPRPHARDTRVLLPVDTERRFAVPPMVIPRLHN